MRRKTSWARASWSRLRYYAIKGTATGTDMTNPDQPQTLTKPFEMDVTCP
ncbi:lipoprotein LpqH [Mycobacterium sp. 050272]